MPVTEAEPQQATMKAVVRDRFGPPDVLRVVEIPKPELPDDRILVRVHASSVNRGDWYTLTGTPWFARPKMGLLKPKSRTFGGDFAGTVEAVGKDVTEIEVGDEVFGSRVGAFAEYVSARLASIAQKPANLTFEQAAAVPVAALTALQGLRDRGGVRAGQRVLLHGASGGVGLFAVQVAQALGAHVNAVCSTRNVALVRSLGAERVFDYTRGEDFTADGRYDVIFDIAGTRKWSEYRRVLNPRGKLVLVGAPKGSRLLGPMSHLAAMKLGALRAKQQAVFFVAKFNHEDMETIRELCESGQLKPVIERTYPLSETAQALRYMGTEHVKAKLVITVTGS
jgi:NADPH:quinone reductase-like Zn-dependent oxidoreductase